jgi:hypothetical protein
MSVSVASIEMDAGRHTVVRFEDHLGGRYMQTWVSPADWTQAQIEAKASALASALEVALAEAEADELIS